METVSVVTTDSMKAYIKRAAELVIKEIDKTDDEQALILADNMLHELLGRLKDKVY